MPINDCVPFFKPGQDVTGNLSVSMPAKHCVRSVSGGRGGLTHIGRPGAGEAILGVLGRDGILGENRHVLVGGIVPIVTSADVKAGDQLEVTATGTVIPRTTGIAVGYATADAASGGAVPTKLYG